MIEQALRYEIEQAIPELTGELYPTHAPETYVKPYLVYTRTKTDITKVLDGYESNHALSFMWSIMTAKYADMASIRDKLEQLLIQMPKHIIGDVAKSYKVDGLNMQVKDIKGLVRQLSPNSAYVEDITIDDINETYEYNLGVNRGIIIFTIYI